MLLLDTNVVIFVGMPNLTTTIVKQEIKSTHNTFDVRS